MRRLKSHPKVERSSEPGSWSLELRTPVPSKKNRYEIRFHPRVLSAVSQVLPYLKGVKRRWWIGPSKAVREAEQLLAWEFKRAIPRDLVGPVSLEVVLGGRRQDVDNVLGCVLDALELSGRIPDDRVVEEARVRRDPGLKGVRVRVLQGQR